MVISKQQIKAAIAYTQNQDFQALSEALKMPGKPKEQVLWLTREVLIMNGFNRAAARV